MKELRTHRVDDDLEKYGRYIDENLDMDQKFYESVMDEVDLHK